MKEKPCMETWCSIDIWQGSENAYEGDQKWPLSFLNVCMWIRTYLAVVHPLPTRGKFDFDSFSVEAIAKLIFCFFEIYLKLTITI